MSQPPIVLFCLLLFSHLLVLPLLHGDIIVQELRSSYNQVSVLFQSAKDPFNSAAETDIRSISGIAISPATGHIFFADQFQYQIFKFSENLGEVELFAGSDSHGYLDGDSMKAKFTTVEGIAFNRDGSLLAIADTNNHLIRLINMTDGRVSTLAGKRGVYGSMDGVGFNATFKLPSGLTFDSTGNNILVADIANHLIRMIELSSGRVTTVAGNGKSGWNGYQGPARSISLNYPNDICFDPSDSSFYFTDRDNAAIRRVNSTGFLTTIIKNDSLLIYPCGIVKIDTSLFISVGYPPYVVMLDLESHEAAIYAGSREHFQGAFDGSLKDAQFHYPNFMAVDPFNSYLLLSDSVSIRSINFKTNFVSTVLRTTGIGISDGFAHQARFNRPQFLSFDRHNQIIYVSDTDNHAIRKILIGMNYKVETIVGQGQSGYVDGSFAVALLNNPFGILVDPDDFKKIYVCDYSNHAIRILNMTAKNVSTFVQRINSPLDIVIDPIRNFYLVTCDSDIQLIDSKGQITKIAGGSVACKDGYGEVSAFVQPYSIVSDLNGTMYFSSCSCNQIKKLTWDSTGAFVDTAAGNDKSTGLSDGYGMDATFYCPRGLQLLDDRVIIVDCSNHAIRELSLRNNSYVKTLSGNGQMGYRNGLSHLAIFFFPSDIAIVQNHSLLIADTQINAVRMIKDGQVTTIAGTGVPIYSSESKNVRSVKSIDQIVCMGDSEAVFVDSLGNSILKMKLNNNGQMETFEALAGNGSPGWLDGVGVSSMFSNPSSIALSRSGSHLLVADTGNHLIRRVDLATSVVTTVAGNGYPGTVINGNPLLSSFNKPRGIAIDTVSDVIYVSDSGNHCIKRINSSNILSLLAGSATGTSGFIDGSSEIARFYNPSSLTLDPVTRILFIADTYNHAIRSLGLDGRVNTVCGVGISGLVDGPASKARLNKPTNLVLQRIADQPVLFAVDSGNRATRVIVFNNDGGNATVSTWLMNELASYKAVAICNGRQILISEKGAILSFSRARFAVSSASANALGEDISNILIALLALLAIIAVLVMLLLYIRLKRQNNPTTVELLKTIGGISKIKNSDQSATVAPSKTVAIAIPGYLQVELDKTIVFPANMKVSAKGGTARVIKCKLKDHKLIEKHGIFDVAVKIFGKDTSKESFLYEVMLMSSLPKSPNLIELLGYSDDRVFAIIMKDYPMSLRDLLVDKTFPNNNETNVKVAVDIANGINLIHQKGIVHFDLKPANVLAEIANGSWNYVVCDFGFANFLSDVQDKIVKGVKKPTAIGITARYAAPELFAKYNMVNSVPSLKDKAPVEIEKNIDVYAYAMTLFYVYAREAPWKDLSLDEIERFAIAGERPEIPSTKFDIPKKIEDLIRQCWSHDPNERPSFDEILKTIVLGE